METEQREEGFEKVVLEKLEWLTQEVGKLNLEERLSLSVEDKRFYSTKEAAGLVGRSAWTVRQFCNRREVKGAHKVAGRGNMTSGALAGKELRSCGRDSILLSAIPKLRENVYPLVGK